jgi:prolyl-tRNA editing enzyme YbaK/EbsC (Cys-tRNA(Pro) deacylase)
LSNSGWEEKATLEKYLKDAKVWYQFVKKDQVVRPPASLPEVVVDLTRVTKGFICQSSRGNYAFLIVPGNQRVSLKRAAYTLGTPGLRLLTPSDAAAVAGYPPGAIPPFFHKTRMETVIDSELLQYETIFCGGGSKKRLLEMRTADVVKLASAVIAYISEREP